jgi:hypothetical protein
VEDMLHDACSLEEATGTVLMTKTETIQLTFIMWERPPRDRVEIGLLPVVKYVEVDTNIWLECVNVLVVVRLRLVRDQILYEA